MTKRWRQGRAPQIVEVMEDGIENTASCVGRVFQPLLCMCCDSTSIYIYIVFTNLMYGSHCGFTSFGSFGRRWGEAPAMPGMPAKAAATVASSNVPTDPWEEAEGYGINFEDRYLGVPPLEINIRARKMYIMKENVICPFFHHITGEPRGRGVHPQSNRP